MRVGVIGTGYVGLIQAVGLAELGFNVVAYDIDPSKIEKLKKGIPPIYEKDLEGLLRKNLGRLSFTTDINDLKGCEVFFICVGTPQDAKGKANLNFVFSAVESLKPLLGGKEIVVLKSTVPVGTNRRVQQILGDKAYVVSNPEFLREGIAVYDFFNPERVVLGFGENSPEWVEEKMLSLYRYFVEKKVPFVVTNWESAELIKYASNTFLAMKISFVNELARLAEKTGADIRDIATGMGLDSRIGKKFLNAGIGWGGSCFHPKEVVCVKTPEGVRVLEFHQLEEYENLPLEVLSWNGKTFSWKKLKYLTRRFYSGNLVRVRLPLGRGVEVTEDHPMVVYENGLLKQVLAKDLKKGQKILLPSGGLESEKPLEVDLFKPLSQGVENLKYKNPAFVKKHFATLKGKLKGVYRYPYEVKRTGVLKAEALRDKIQLLEGENGRLFTVERNSVPQRVVLDGDLARL
ncbi:MAG TPA: nucleotide sugar dehydrogenase, partial [Aquifex sp.]|nr:nucleotide sugar dehydrogenase [Aquifex sp.]